MGPNHKDGCTGNTWTYSGAGYNRVKLCACGAEDHAPSDESIRGLFDLIHDMPTHNTCCRRHGTLVQLVMMVCPKCGHKRCPRATLCTNACTGSNDVGQPGSDY